LVTGLLWWEDPPPKAFGFWLPLEGGVFLANC